MKIIFVCTGNTCRSPMAMGIFQKMIKENYPNLENEITVSSGGLATISGDSVAQNAVVCCSEIGVDISNHIPYKIEKEDFNKYDLFVGITATHSYILERAGLELTKITMLQGDIADPYGCDLQTYRNCRDEIVIAIGKLMQLLV